MDVRLPHIPRLCCRSTSKKDLHTRSLLDTSKSAAPSVINTVFSFLSLHSFWTFEIPVKHQSKTKNKSFIQLKPVLLSFHCQILFCQPLGTNHEGKRQLRHHNRTKKSCISLWCRILIIKDSRRCERCHSVGS